MLVKLTGMHIRLASLALSASLAIFATAAVAQPAPPLQEQPGPGGPPDQQVPQDQPAPPAPHGLPGGDPHEGLVTPPDQLPKIQRGDRNRNIEFLFGALKVAPDDASAKAVEDRIWAVWTAAGNETTNLLMSRAKKAMDDKDYDLALKVLGAILEIKPDFTEAWNRRATVYFMKRDYANSLADISKVLQREPRHFGALSGLGIIMQEVGDDKRALDAYRKALEVYPRLKGMEEKVKNLKEKVEGRDI
jgi:tetratricopeptide (TPR) repeat protein